MKRQFGLALFFILLQNSYALAKGVLLDVRTPEEYAEGHLPGALNMDVLNKNFRDQVSILGRDDNYKVYCKSGRRATQAVTIMKELGFKNLTNLGGYEEAQRTLKLSPTTAQ